MHRSGVSHTWPQTHPNLPKGTTHPNLPQGTTHPNLPQGKELVTPTKCHQPPPSLPRRGGTDTPGHRQSFDIQSNQHLPYGGEREGAEVID